MDKVLSIEQLRKMAQTTIDIPDFNNTGTIKVRVRRPRLMALAAEGKIPNHLLEIASTMVTGQSNKKGTEAPLTIKNVAGMLELYCKVCLVEPTYAEFKDIMTDDQMEAIFDWAMEGMKQLDNFREDKEDGAGHNPSEQAQKKTK